MPNRNYEAGRRLEWEVKADLEALGYIVIRAAGSHGHADLVALNPRKNGVILLQCKRVSDEAGARQVEKEWHKSNPFPRNLYTQILAVKVKGEGGWRKVYMS